MISALIISLINRVSVKIKIALPNIYANARSVLFLSLRPSLLKWQLLLPHS